MNRFASLEPANCNGLSDAPTMRVPECPSPDVALPKHDETLSTLHVVESDHMDAHHYRALALQMKSREVGHSRTAVSSGVRRKRSR